MAKQVNLGVIGISEGNGHPYSFSSIINGFNPEEIKNSGWKNIYGYLKERDESEFGFEDVGLTHVWTQDIKESEKIAKVAKIPNVTERIEEMIPYIDGVIIARDDYENHFNLASKFLQSNKFVFVDKPLSLNVNDLRFFKEYLKGGKLMSCSGLRYAKELDWLRANASQIGEIKLIRGAVIKSLEKYGIHMLDGIFNVVDFQVESVYCFSGKSASLTLKNKDDSLIHIDALGISPLTFQFDFWSDKERFNIEVNDWFSMFRRTLFHFIKMIKTEKQVMDPDHVINLMRVLIAADMSKKEKREVKLNEIRI